MIFFTWQAERFGLSCLFSRKHCKFFYWFWPIYKTLTSFLTVKRLRERESPTLSLQAFEGKDWFPCLWFFPKVYLLERGWFLVFCDFLYYHMSHLSWQFHWGFSSCSENRKIFSVNMNYFHHFFDFFDISLMQKINDTSM